jgi:hypothetical protein
MGLKLIYLTDSGRTWEQAEEYFQQAAHWAHENCLSYQGCDVVDVTDVCYEYDQIAEYGFDDEQDATLFALRWS